MYQCSLCKGYEIDGTTTPFGAFYCKKIKCQKQYNKVMKEWQQAKEEDKKVIDKLIKNNECIFAIPNCCYCHEPVIPNKHYCQEHLTIKCHCGKQAVTYCDGGHGSMVCGLPLCDNCICGTHSPYPCPGCKQS